MGVTSFREGTHACALDGKKSLSAFKLLAYDDISDTSLVECRPLTGRTHQLRVHLQLLGNPIANDPCYGGELFYNDQERRALAIKYLQTLRDRGLEPLSRHPHLHQLSLFEKDSSGEQRATTSSSSSCSASTSHGENSLISSAMPEITEQKKEEEYSKQEGEGEIKENDLTASCSFCQDAREKVSDMV